MGLMYIYDSNQIEFYQFVDLISIFHLTYKKKNVKNAYIKI